MRRRYDEEMANRLRKVFDALGGLDNALPRTGNFPASPMITCRCLAARRAFLIATRFQGVAALSGIRNILPRAAIVAQDGRRPKRMYRKY